MSSFGIVEVITLLLGLSGLGVGTNPTPPTAEIALEHAIADADLVAHLDAATVIPGNYAVLTGLKDHPQIKASPELAKAVRRAVTDLDVTRGLVKQTTGIDLVTDVSDATTFVRMLPRGQEPQLLVAARGKFSAANIDKIAKLSGTAAVAAGAAAWVEIEAGMAVGVTKGGVLLAGTTALVKERVADTWRRPALTPNSHLGNVADIINAKPVFAVAINMSKTARADVLLRMRGQNFASDLVKRHKFAAFSVFRDGAGWTWHDSTKAGLAAMVQVSEGTIEILRAAQIAPRGFAKIALGALESYRGTNKQVDALLARKADVEKIVQSYTGDGQFKAAVQPDAANLKLTVRLTGKAVSEVLPLGGALPLAGVGAWLALSADPSSPMVMPAPLPPPPSMMPKRP